MTKLEKIDLSENEDLNDISAIKNLINLKEINLIKCDLNNLDVLKEMTELEKIDLSEI